MPITTIAMDSKEDPLSAVCFAHRRQRVYPYLSTRGFFFVDCRGPRARRNVVALEARNASVSFITGTGHGLPDLIFGSDGAPIFRVNQYDPLEVRGKIIHLMACQTALRLGPDMVQNGCRAFFGYDADFVFPPDPDEADIVLDCDAEIDRALADGLTAGQVFKRVRELYRLRIREAEEAGNVQMYQVLSHNFTHLCTPSRGAVWGSAGARL